MVLEHIFPDDWLGKARYAFLLGFLYSVIGIGLAKTLFPADPALVAVAFTSLLMLPELYKLFSIEERKEGREKQFSMKKLARDNSPFVKTYIFIFLGILLAYSIASMFLPSFEVNTLFREQLEFRINDNVAGAAASPLFADLLQNNFWVLIACFLIALLTGDGAIFLITWNASLWGTVFGVTARNAAALSQINPWYYFALIMLIVLPHMLLEALSYITAAISGAVISKDVLLEKFDSKRFFRVFQYNLVLLIIALVLLVAGVLVETFVLENSAKYMEIVAASYM